MTSGLREQVLREQVLREQVLREQVLRAASNGSPGASTPAIAPRLRQWTRFGPDNVEAIVEVIDACSSQFESYWVFAAGLTNVDATSTVKDRRSGEVRIY